MSLFPITGYEVIFIDFLRYQKLEQHKGLISSIWQLNPFPLDFQSYQSKHLFLGLFQKLFYQLIVANEFVSFLEESL